MGPSYPCSSQWGSCVQGALCRWDVVSISPQSPPLPVVSLIQMVSCHLASYTQLSPSFIYLPGLQSDLGLKL